MGINNQNVCDTKNIISDKSGLFAPTPSETHKYLLKYTTNLYNENSWAYFTFDNKMILRNIKDFFTKSRG